jgi:hypothetical protein
MRLWKILHTLYQGKKTVRRPDHTRARLRVEALDQRLLPSSFSWGMSQTLPTLAAPQYDLTTHQAGVSVSSFQWGVSAADAANRSQPSHQITLQPTESLSLNFTPPSIELHSFSWGV